MKFFRKFGEVTRVERFVKEYGPTRSTKSYYVLTTYDVHAYNSIINSDSILYKKRKLFCIKFMTGYELECFNLDMSKKRFLVKYVPTCVSEIELRALLEINSLPIEKIYKLENDSLKEGGNGTSSRNNGNPRHSTYGILYLDSLLSSKLPDSFKVYSQKRNCQISVQRFLYKKSRNPQGETRNLETAITRTGKYIKEEKNSNHINNMIDYNQRILKREYNPAQKKEKVKTFNSIHFEKPTSIKYNQIRKREVINTCEHRSEMRFNILKKINNRELDIGTEFDFGEPLGDRL